jgi:DMSO/TMAO reductase YedYZ molybdopterin-dependent catalytic subunit
MDRRQFIFASIALPLSVKRLMAEHHVVSADPLTVDFDIRSLKGRYTTVEDFYVRNHNGVPPDTEAISLRIEGEVARPLEITPNQLAPLERRKLGAVLECAGNSVRTLGMVSDGVWEGWSLSDVLSLAHPTSTGVYVSLFGRDGYGRSVPIDRVQNGGMIVTHLNARRLTRHHGAPWRALFPGWYGMDAVKWLERIVVSKTALPSNQMAYLELRQTASSEPEARPLPRIQVKSLILSPENGAVLRHGKVQTRGVAWSGEGQIARVEVTADGGINWQPATVERGSLYDWGWWQSELELRRPGAVKLICRATDQRGYTQPVERDPKRLDGYVNNWFHYVTCVVV